MRKFDTNVQYLDYDILKAVAKEAFNCPLSVSVAEISRKAACAIGSDCGYNTDAKGDVILSEKIKLAFGGDKENPNVIEVITSACDECPHSGYEVTSICRGCVSHPCFDSCRRNAISFGEDKKAHIDKSKCVNCSLCAKVCPYGAIHNYTRPCQDACKINAIGIADNNIAKIDNSKCVYCGACSKACPFGAISQKSFIVDVIKMLKSSKEEKKYNVYAIFAPAIASQFSWAKLGQVINGIKQLGFYNAVEVALGADMIVYTEAEEFLKKGILTSSCCPAFVEYIHKSYPELTKYISHNNSPMVEIAKFIKENDKTAKVVFIGPCSAKKMEFQKSSTNNYVDLVITFEELQALFDAKNIDLTTLEEASVDNASEYGRIFARSGGLTQAVRQGIIEHNDDPNKLKPVICNGLADCKTALMKLSKNILDGNFIEGMACQGGCINGAGCLTRGPKNKVQVDTYGANAKAETLLDAITSADILPK